MFGFCRFLSNIFPPSPALHVNGMEGLIPRASTLATPPNADGKGGADLLPENFWSRICHVKILAKIYWKSPRFFLRWSMTKNWQNGIFASSLHWGQSLKFSNERHNSIFFKSIPAAKWGFLLCLLWSMRHAACYSPIFFLFGCPEVLFFLSFRLGGCVSVLITVIKEQARIAARAIEILEDVCKSMMLGICFSSSPLGDCLLQRCWRGGSGGGVGTAKGAQTVNPVAEAPFPPNALQNLPKCGYPSLIWPFWMMVRKAPTFAVQYSPLENFGGKLLDNFGEIQGE